MPILSKFTLIPQDNSQYPSPITTSAIRFQLAHGSCLDLNCGFAIRHGSYLIQELNVLIDIFKNDDNRYQFNVVGSKS